MKKLDYHIGLAKESITKDKDKVALYTEVDRHRLGQWKPSDAMSKLPWIAGKNFSTTAAADALDSGARVFATMMPQISIAPLDDNPAEYERVEMHETALDWHLRRMNMWGGKTTHWKIMESAMRYCAVAFETEYLPYLYKGKKKDKRKKALLNGSAFRWTVHHPGTVHPFHSKYGLESVVLEKEIPFYDLVAEFGEDSVRELRDKLFSKTPNMGEMMARKVWFYKCVTWDETCIYASPNKLPSEKDAFTILHEEHGLDFIPWVVTDNEDPILKNAINTGLLDNLNNLRLMSFSAAVSLVAASQQLIQTADGTLRGVSIDNQNPQQPLVTDLTAKVTPLPQQRPNDAVEQKVQQATQDLYATTVAQILSDTSKLTGSENFSTANLAYNIAVGALSLAKEAAERAISSGLYQMFQWIEHAGTEPLVAFREKSKEVQGSQKMKGKEIVIRKDDFDTRYLYIDVKLREYKALDEQAKWNLAIMQVERMGLSKQVVAEELGVENFPLHEQKRAAEDMMQAEVQAYIKAKLAEVDMAMQQQMQASQMQMQQQAMQQQAPQNQVQGMNASYPMADGVDMRGGSMPAQPMNPMENRESIQGMDANGMPLA